ncbi:MAG: restriction endonuclease subunit S [Bacilli bacterium]
MSRVLVDSGIGYLGNIPSEWNIFRIKNAFKCKKNIVNDNWSNTQLLSLTTSGVKEKDIDNPNGKLPDSFNGYQYVEINNIIMCLFDLDCSAVFSGISKYNGMISPAYKVLTCNEIMNADFAGYYFNYIGFDRKYMHYSKNIRYTLNYDEFSSLPMLIPPLEEQKRISSYLDNQCAKIDEIISDNNHEIELLEEYKRTILKNELGNNVSSKKYRIKNIANLKGRIGWQGLTTADYIEEGPYLITGVDFNESKGSINWESCVHISEERYEEAPEIHVLSNDLLITKDGTIGKLAIISENREASLNSGVMLIRIKDKSVCNVKYLYYLLKSDYFWDWYNSSQRGSSTIKHLYQEQFYNFSFFLPDLAHQEKVIKKIDDQFFKLDQVINYRKQIIEKLEEYKKSLIYEYVTGKREV